MTKSQGCEVGHAGFREAQPVCSELCNLGQVMELSESQFPLP